MWTHTLWRGPSSWGDGVMDSHAFAWPLELRCGFARFGVAPQVGVMDSHAFRTLKQDAAKRVTSSKIAELLDAGISEEQDAAIRVSVAQKVTCRAPFDETKPLALGDWLSDKDIIAWLNHKLYHNEIGEPHAWTTKVTCIVSRLNIMKKYKGREGTSQSIVGLAWSRRRISIVNSDDREGFVCLCHGL